MVAAQETHLSEQRCDEVSDKLARSGWRAVATPSVGVSAGHAGHGELLQLAPRSSGLGVFEIGQDNVLAPGRAAFAHAAGPFPGGLAQFNVYLKVGEGLSPLNLSILDTVARAIRAIKKPYAAVGDFNVEPSELASADILNRISAKAATPAEGAVRPSGKTIDYFWCRT